MEVEKPVRLGIRGGIKLTAHASEFIRKSLGDVSWRDAQSYVSNNDIYEENLNPGITKPKYYVGDIELIPDENGIIGHDR